MKGGEKKMMRTEVRFPTGFSTYVDVKRSPRIQPKAPMVTVTRVGTLVFNAEAASLLWGRDRGKPNEAVMLAYNPKTKVLAVKPVPAHVKFPITLHMTVTGVYRRHATVSFKTFARVWNIPPSGNRYLCSWNEKRKMLMVDLSRPAILARPKVARK